MLPHQSMFAGDFVSACLVVATQAVSLLFFFWKLKSTNTFPENCKASLPFLNIHINKVTAVWSEAAFWIVPSCFKLIYIRSLIVGINDLDDYVLLQCHKHPADASDSRSKLATNLLYYRYHATIFSKQTDVSWITEKRRSETKRGSP